ncbi:hypothetical protein, partial [Klebsiella pneumoniae]|uniref:hypothetical protein n=1 Tax=Klebsiella pneumoniae TaxID=573 RepID=UPI00300ABBAA
KIVVMEFIWTEEECGRLQSLGSQRWTQLSTHTTPKKPSTKLDNKKKKIILPNGGLSQKRDAK